MNDAPQWGIEPVPRRLRLLGTFDGFLLWANLSVSLLVIVAGAFLVLPASQYGLGLTLPVAIGAIVAAAVVGSLMLGTGGLIGADAGVPGMVLQRAPLGRRGSYLPTGLNIVQCLGWSVFELIVIATGASALSEHVFGFGGAAFWKILFGVIATILAFLGPVGFVRRYVRKFAVWIVVVSLLYLCWWSLHGQDVQALWHRDGSHAFWPGFDLVLASIISWTPLVADYTRFSRTRSAGFWGSGLGYFVPTIPLFGLGAVIAMSRQIGDAPGLLTAIAAGGAASVLALLALTVDESDEAFANVYSGAVSLQNLVPRAPQRLLVAGTAALATIGALLIDLRNYPALPLPARIVLRAALRRPPRRLAARRAPLQPRRHLRWARRSALADRGLARRLLPVPVALPGRPGLVDEPRRAHRPALAAVGRRLPPELRARLRPHLRRRSARAPTRPRTRVIALLGNLSRDVIGGQTRTGGAPFHAARALQHLDAPALIYARCAEADREELLPPARRARDAGALHPGEEHRELRDLV